MLENVDLKYPRTHTENHTEN